MVLLSGRLTHPKWEMPEMLVQSNVELKGEFDSNASDQGCPLSVLPTDIQRLITSGVEIGEGDNLRISRAMEEYRRDLITKRDRECGLNLPG